MPLFNATVQNIQKLKSSKLISKNLCISKNFPELQEKNMTALNMVSFLCLVLEFDKHNNKLYMD